MSRCVQCAHCVEGYRCDLIDEKPRGRTEFVQGCYPWDCVFADKDGGGGLFGECPYRSAEDGRDVVCREAEVGDEEMTSGNFCACGVRRLDFVEIPTVRVSGLSATCCQKFSPAADVVERTLNEKVYAWGKFPYYGGITKAIFDVVADGRCVICLSDFMRAYVDGSLNEEFRDGIWLALVDWDIDAKELIVENGEVVGLIGFEDCEDIEFRIPVKKSEKREGGEA